VAQVHLLLLVVVSAFLDGRISVSRYVSVQCTCLAACKDALLHHVMVHQPEATGCATHNGRLSLLLHKSIQLPV
jgi:hypothetical protein